jgi:C_GCAxxG_C_C family probable redox protein
MQKVVEEVYNLAFKYEAEKGSCPQCVLAALKEKLNVGDEALIRSSDALAGGTAGSTEGTCGALAGGLMAISFILGRKYQDFRAGKRERDSHPFKKLYNLFIAEYGSPICKEVQKKIFGRSFRLWDPKEYEEFEKAGGHVDKCPRVTGNVAKWTAEIILEL